MLIYLSSLFLNECVLHPCHSLEMLIRILPIHPIFGIRFVRLLATNEERDKDYIEQEYLKREMDKDQKHENETKY